MSTRGFTGRRPGADAARRLPPGQQQTEDFPVLSLGPAPAIDLDAWRFTLRHGARPLASWNWAEFNALPRTRWHGDIHCVTTWSKFGTDWEGVTLDDLLLAAGVQRRRRSCWRNPGTTTIPMCRWRTWRVAAR